MQVGWLACAHGAARGLPWLGPLTVGIYLVLHLLWIPQRGRELKTILVTGVLGLGIDSLKKVTGLLTYQPGLVEVPWLAPFWIVAMWMLFASALNTSLKWLQGRYWLAAPLGAIFGPLSYVAGAGLGAVRFNHSMTLSVAVLALVWGSVVPGLVWLARRLETAD